MDRKEGEYNDIFPDMNAFKLLVSTHITLIDLSKSGKYVNKKCTFLKNYYLTIAIELTNICPKPQYDNSY